MKAVVFKTQGDLDTRAITVMGVNSKPHSGGPIGYFGTGLKYAIAVLLRTGHKVIIRTEKTDYWFESRKADFRGKDFDFLFMKWRKAKLLSCEVALPFTTELGKNWQLWQAFRELYANTLDEHGTTELLDHLDGFGDHQAVRLEKGYTKIIVLGDDFAAEYLEREKTFLPDAHHTQHSDQGVQHFVKPSQHVYYRGLRVMDLEKPAKLTYNILSKIDLTEDRTAKHSWEVEQKIREYVTQSDDEELIRIVTTAPEGSYENRFNFSNNYYTPSSTFSSVIRSARRSGSLKGVNPTALTYVETYDPETREDVKKEQVIPPKGSIWRHHRNDKLYKVILVANQDAEEYKQDEYPLTVVYEDPEGRIWSRLFERWHPSFTMESNPEDEIPY